MTNGQIEALRVLKALSTEKLEAGMKAFEHLPCGRTRLSRQDATGCFVYEAYGRRIFSFAEAPLGHELSIGYEIYNDWFKGECIRELAERGVVVEPAAVVTA